MKHADSRTVRKEIPWHELQDSAKTFVCSRRGEMVLYELEVTEMERTRTMKRSRKSLWILASVVVLMFVAMPATAAIIHTAVYNGHTYHLLDIDDDWVSAEASAVALGGHLVTVNDATEDQWLYDTFSPHIDTSTMGCSLWTGLNDAVVEGTSVWSSGEVSTYTNHPSYRPDGYNTDTRDYVRMDYWYNHSSNPGGWLPDHYWIYDNPETWMILHPCVEVVPEPATTALLLLGLPFALRRRKR